MYKVVTTIVTTILQGSIRLQKPC